MLSLENLSLDAHHHNILSDLSLSLLPGSIVHLTGYNGCGKTTLLRAIAGITPPSKGVIKLLKTDINHIQKPFVTYIAHQHGINMEMTALDNMILWAEITNTTMLLSAAMDYFKFSDLELEQKCYKLSAGNLQKLSLSRLILWPSILWLLDEFDSNLDKDNRKLIEQLISSKAHGGGIVIFTSHHRLEDGGVLTLNLENYLDGA